MSDNRNEYSFKNGAFIGFVLVNEPPKEAQAAIASMQIRGEEIPVRLQTHSDR